MALETIYSVGEGRTVLLAVDGCLGCLNAFEEFIRDKAEPEDRIVTLVKGGRARLPEGKFSGPLLPKGMAKSLLPGSHRPPSTNVGVRLAERDDCKVKNRVIVPGKPLIDYTDWDRASKNILTKLAQRADQTKTRFEAIRVAAGARQNLWVEAVMENCTELDADLLVVASHKKPNGPQARSLSAVFSVNTKCPVLVLGKKTPPEATVPPEEEEEEEESEKQEQGNLWPLRRTVSTLGKPFSKSASFGPIKGEASDFPQPKNRGSGLTRPPSKNNNKHQRKSSDDSDLPAKSQGSKVKAPSLLAKPRSFVLRREASAPGRLQQDHRPLQIAQKVREACQRAVDMPRDLINSYMTP